MQSSGRKGSRFLPPDTNGLHYRPRTRLCEVSAMQHGTARNDEWCSMKFCYKGVDSIEEDEITGKQIGFIRLHKTRKENETKDGNRKEIDSHGKAVWDKSDEDRQEKNSTRRRWEVGTGKTEIQDEM